MQFKSKVSQLMTADILTKTLPKKAFEKDHESFLQPI